jgi:hypothetical protein
VAREQPEVLAGGRRKLAHHETQRLEGGKRPIEAFTDSLRNHKPEVLRKFFVENGRLLFPD